MSRLIFVIPYTNDVVDHIVSTQTFKNLQLETSCCYPAYPPGYQNHKELSEPYDFKACSFVDCSPHCAYKRICVQDLSHLHECWSFLNCLSNYVLHMNRVSLLLMLHISKGVPPRKLYPRSNLKLVGIT